MDDRYFERLIGSLVTQHTIFFPKATIETQFCKLDEELEEYTKATTLGDRAEELGDVLYVIVSLQRFPEVQKVADYLLQKFHYEKSETAQITNARLLLEASQKVEARHKKGAYKWTGSKYEREKNA